MTNKLIIRERCFARIGKSAMMSLKATWPLSKFEFYDDHMVLQVFIKKISLKFDEIDSIEKYSHPIDIGLGVGIKINHHTDASIYLAFWPKKLDEIIDLFKTKNVSVKIENN
jgi:hypothetical protein